MNKLPVTANPTGPVIVRSHRVAFTARERLVIEFPVHFLKSRRLTELQGQLDALNRHCQVVRIAVIIRIDNGFVEGVGRVETDVTS